MVIFNGNRVIIFRKPSNSTVTKMNVIGIGIRIGIYILLATSSQIKAPQGLATSLATESQKE